MDGVNQWPVPDSLPSNVLSAHISQRCETFPMRQNIPANVRRMETTHKLQSSAVQSSPQRSSPPSTSDHGTCSDALMRFVPNWAAAHRRAFPISINCPIRLNADVFNASYVSTRIRPAPRKRTGRDNTEHNLTPASDGLWASRFSSLIGRERRHSWSPSEVALHGHLVNVGVLL